ncbi:hypothetical protein MCOR02_008636 [Pyricularia oryzae]|uniref:4Fe-4S Mo/W bis-MGD-type domain-containing protein n=2 Tax=Pyricularia TaxID=48558 RepID=A0ABQ8P2G7_PYRGI|nr:hypothetical protein MCOR01_004646 [Pyricularia oryzae]KAI6305049.1 hypothetical protein MCOR33_000166 [Pyricularia grisea]KAH9431341.1 hypothetical protein MCOR02_008636 [Pyricularia oryzae]KAI6261902.1 hypothetical protein MCOR19_001853 [Pyricularia oryzae]KAI6287914.1 hypothetical protein MCOR26_000328 [Pyricularia oryzae]
MHEQLSPTSQCRNSIEDIWGPRAPYKAEWPRRVDYAWDEEPEKWVQSACVLCSNGCGLDIGVKDGYVVGVRGRATDRVNKGRLGPKGLHGWKSIHSKDRLTHPLIRRNGRLEQASWDEAMDLIVRKSKSLSSTLTNHSISFYTSGQLFLEEYYALALVGKAGLNTLHMDGNTRLCTATAAASMRESFGSDGQAGSYTDIDYTDCIFMVGHNMAATQTVLWSRILDRLEGPHPPKLIVVDPRRSEVAKKAVLHLAPKIGTNLALLNGIQHVMFENKWVDADFIAKHTIGVSELRETVKDYTPEYVEKLTEVPAADIETAAYILGQTQTLLSTALQGVYQSNQATASACQINNINLIRGLIGKPGSGVLQMNGQPTAQNNRETGCDGEFPGFRNHQNPRHMQELADLWNIDVAKLPHWCEPTHIQNMLNFMEQGSIRMCWISGTNPLVSLPDLPRIRRIFSSPEMFVVCQDIFMTETGQLADVVLPAAQWGEKTGCFTNVDRTVHISHNAVDPPGEARSDLDIFLDYSRRMGFKDKDGKDLLPYTTPEEVFEAWKRVSAGRPCDYTGLSYDKLTGGSGIQWPCNQDWPMGRERLYEAGRFYTDLDECESFGHDLETGAPHTVDQYRVLNPAGRAILKSCRYMAHPEEPSDEYPLRLATGRNVYQFHTRTKTGRAPALRKACAEPEVRLSEKDAASFNVKDGDMVIVRSRRGAVEVKARIGDIIPGQAFITFHFGSWGSEDGRARAANDLTISYWDPISKQPTFKAGAVRIEKIPPDTKGPCIRETQSEAAKNANKRNFADADADAASMEADLAGRERHLEIWLGECQECIVQLAEIYSQIIPRLVHDSEVQGGLKVLEGLAESTRTEIQAFAAKYGENKQTGRSRAKVLREALFPREDEPRSPHRVLETLQGLNVYLAHIEGTLLALTPASAALWDKDFQGAVAGAKSMVSRMRQWAENQILVRGPQTLLVPAKALRDEHFIGRVEQPR